MRSFGKCRLKCPVIRSWVLAFAWVGVAGLSLPGCGSLGYLYQAANGQLALMNHARPVEELLKDPQTPPRLRRLLSEIGPIKEFAEKQGLKPTRNYREYVQMDRPVAVWVVIASEEFRFKAKEWSFPLVGSFNSLGWFARADADAYAAGVQKEGWDVDVRGTAAYSTLGWFHDPILSTMIPEGDGAMGALVNTVLHESLHATVYVNNQSYFNESLACVVADKLTPEYLSSRPNITVAEREAYRQMEKRSEARAELFRLAYERLSHLYDSSGDANMKRVEKARILRQLTSDAGLAQDPNNATIIQFRTYDAGRPYFERLYAALGKDMGRMIETLRKVNREDFPKDQAEDWPELLKRVKSSGAAGAARQP